MDDNMKAFQKMLQEAVESAKSLWRHRKGMEIPAAIQDTIDALFADRKPLLVNISRDEGWLLTFALPPGRSYAEFKKLEPYFADASGCAVQIYKERKAVRVKVMTEDLGTSYPYKWDYAPYKEMALPFPVGYSPLGLLVRDFAEIVNLLVTGHPGSGKSAWLHMLITSLLLSRNVYVCIIDRKKLEYQYLKDHALVVTSNKEATALLKALTREMDRRLKVLAGYNNFYTKLQEIPGYEATMPFVVLVIDEMAELEGYEAQELLNRYVRLGRSPGMLCVGATQRPSATMFESTSWSDSKAMFPGTLCFHVRDEINSRICLGNDRAAHIPNVPGRGIFQFDVELEVQGMYLPPSQAIKLLNGQGGSGPKGSGGSKGVVFDVGESCKRLSPR